jgi:hypothetical protein
MRDISLWHKPKSLQQKQIFNARLAQSGLLMGPRGLGRACGLLRIIIAEPVLAAGKAARRSSIHTTAGSSHTTAGPGGHDTGRVGNVEHCGQNQWAHRQPHGPLHSFPLTIAPRATRVTVGGSQ